MIVESYSTLVRRRLCDAIIVLTTATSLFLVGCATTTPSTGGLQNVPLARDADKLLIVDCLLPGQMRRLGRSITFLTPRRPVKVPTSECEIRGGEYVAFDRANFATSLKIWLPQAKEGDPEAQTYVGEIFEKGLGLQADPVVAAQWYQRASDQGFSRARINLGYLYENGIGVEKDLVKAMNLYRMASGFGEGSLEYVTAFEVATRKQQVVDLSRQEQEISGLKQSVALLEQKNSEFQQRQVQLIEQEKKVKEQRQLVLSERAALGTLQGEAGSTQNELVSSLAQVDQLQNSLVASEIEKKDLFKRFQEQQVVTEKLQLAYNQSSGELKQARQELSEQEQRLGLLQEKVRNSQSVLSAAAVLEAQERLSVAEDDFNAKILDSQASQRAMAQESALLQVQISNAKAREGALQVELSRVVDDLSGAEVDSALLEVQLKSQVDAHTQQMQQLRRQLSLSSQELLLVQSRLEASQSAIAGVDAQQIAVQSDLVGKRQASEKKITELENQIAKAQNRELNFRSELERLSVDLAGSSVDSKKRELSLEEKIADQRNNLNALESELAKSKTEREGIRKKLDDAQNEIASTSVELNAIRDQLIKQKASYEAQIAASYQVEESLAGELQRLEGALASDQVDKVKLERQLNDQLTAAKQQSEQFASQLARSEQELGKAKLALQQNAGKYGDQSSELLELGNLLEQQQTSLASQKAIAEQQDSQYQAEIERLSFRAADSEKRNQLLTIEINEQKSKIAELTSLYVASADALSQADGSLGGQQEVVAQLKDELQRVRFDSLSSLSSSRAELNQNKQALKETQAQYEAVKAEAQRLRSRQSNSSKELEEQLAEANVVEQTLKQQLESANQTTDSLEKQLVDQEKKYQVGMAAAKGQLELARDESFEKMLQLAGLESQLNDQKARLTEQETEINSLQTKVTKAQAFSDKPSSQFFQQTVEVGPAIEIIEPAITVTRGGPALTMPSSSSSSGKVDVIGKIRPSESILSFKIAGESVPINDNGVFTYAANSSDSVLRMRAINDAGERTDLELKFSKPKGIAISQDTSNKADLSGIQFGSYHALIIGNNKFESLQDLRTAETDAITVEKLLREKYGFQTKLLLNATRYDILSGLNEMREILTDEDNLLIYYAGHGELANETGYWLPVDAEPDNEANWIANTTITKYVETMNAKHVIVIADSCYSGTLSRTSLSRLSKGLTGKQQRKWYETIASSKVRTVFTSGGVKPVLDSVGGSRHSVFSAAFIDELESSSSKVVSTYKLFLKVQERVKVDAARIGVDQNPQYSPMQFAGHESGEFLFLLDGNTESAELNLDDNSQLDYAQKVAANSSMQAFGNY